MQLKLVEINRARTKLEIYYSGAIFDSVTKKERRTGKKAKIKLKMLKNYMLRQSVKWTLSNLNRYKTIYTKDISIIIKEER